MAAEPGPGRETHPPPPHQQPMGKLLPIDGVRPYTQEDDIKTTKNATHLLFGLGVPGVEPSSGGGAGRGVVGGSSGGAGVSRLETRGASRRPGIDDTPSRCLQHNTQNSNNHAKLDSHSLDLSGQ